MCRPERAGAFPVPCRPCALLLILVCLLFAGCLDFAQDKEKKAAVSTQEVQTQTSANAEPAPAATPSAKPEERVVSVYALSTPLPPASPEELDLAQRQVDYANRADKGLTSLCGRYPLLIMMGVQEYRDSYTTLSFGREAPAATCLARAITPPKGLFSAEDSEALRTHIATMDRQRESMRRNYASLRAYVKDTSIVDDGKKGRQLTGQIEKSYLAYAAALEAYKTLLDARAAQAQDVILRDHPLRDHVQLATDMVSILRRVADGLEVTDPDPASLDEPIARLRADITRAERLPFPIAGATEMYYRNFLKDARSLLALLLRGQLESFHPDVRTALNSQWASCRQKYNAFVDALAGERG